MMLVLSACQPETYTAQAPLGDGASARMQISGSFSLQSDWNRSIVIETPEGQIVQPLFEDTGWWRGSHLYLHRSGTYVVHEGQNGCFAFVLEPLAFRSRANISCEKQQVSEHEARKVFEGLPASNYYDGLYYVGRWVEQGPDHAAGRLVFQSVDTLAEGELPDIL
ncbi:MAG: hypothetical protein N4A61_08060 [Pelagimonas sp.]|nr:hypothetical protein [Pelagimonas sp.]